VASLAHPLAAGSQPGPDSDDYRIGYIKTLADARKDGEALSEARRLVAEQASVAHLQTLSYVYLRLGKSWDQLLVDTQILDREPQNKAALASLMATLTRNRIDSPALGLANSVELTPAEKRNLQLNAAAELVRLADTPSREEKARYALARTALTQYDAMIAAWHPDPQAAPDIIRARIDRLGALYASAEYAQVIREYQSLIAQQQTVPDWAIGWVISSYIALKQIEPALTLIHQHPSWLTSQQNEEHELFYALLDTGQYPAAQRYVARLTRNAPYIRRLYGSPTPQPNDDWLTAQSLNVHYLAATNDLPQAEARMQRLAATAPGNQGLQIDYAALLQDRGLPRAAERQLKAAESLEPASLQLERQQAWVALDLQEWRQMDLLTDDVVARSPRDLNTQRLARAREIHHLSELRLSVGKGLHSDNPVSGTHDLSFETAIYSPPLADSWRLFGGHRFAEGNFEEGKAAVASCLPVLNGVRATTGASLSSPASIFTARTSPASAFPPPMTLAIAGSWAANWSGFRSRRRCARYATASAPTAAKAGCAGIKTNAGSTASARPPAGLPIATAARSTPSPVKNASGKRRG
jgi:biofilm PGA synthesis protein PgaA